MKEFTKDLLDVLVKHNIVDKRSLRDFLIRQRYFELFDVKKMKSKDARKLLADEFNLGEKSIEYIVYLQKHD